MIRIVLLIISWVTILMSVFKDIKFILWTSIPALISVMSVLTYRKDVVSIENPVERQLHLIYALFFSFQAMVQLYLMGEIMGKYRYLL